MEQGKCAQTWEKTRRQDLWRHRSRTYYARLSSVGKQIWCSQKTPLFSVAEARLAAHVTERRARKVKNASVRQGELTFVAAISVVNGNL